MEKKKQEQNMIPFHVNSCGRSNDIGRKAGMAECFARGSNLLADKTGAGAPRREGRVWGGSVTVMCICVRASSHAWQCLVCGK